MIIIPARLASTRFPEKILAPIHGVPMVIATAKRVQSVDRVAIAADDPQVVNLAKSYGFEAVLTASSHQSGTDRINEAATLLGLNEEEVVINVQGDEPFIEPEIIALLQKRVHAIAHLPWAMASCHKAITAQEAADPNLVKVVLSHVNEALYFSRSPIPYDRDKAGAPYWGHLGLYGFTRATLRAFCALPPAPLEHIEKLEQLRALYHGRTIAMVEVVSQSFGIDTPKDLEKALKLFPSK
ncbi:3-deoxy-manno-octulosonate cytidylyltransferase [Sulfurospirillum sp. T05]|uniref:3-deoxy-manno-octulosonate cytidylyltransferase n=1 Tax=Sulfurospirillum tamanense TaxID=2813362 RepID=A0ABS2WPX4_9BACT|nr:3-deoxy-manno-octulosonate cytidylyltransferase [Sulfurospirillum tamanensis]MBN2963747.1 3-deoxy-manno-octulosonate cytidylyltransferase [Sulfurospirillum tamanensis]